VTGWGRFRDSVLRTAPTLSPCHPPSYRFRLISSPNFSLINIPTFLKSSHTSRLRWSRGSVLAFSTQVCGFKPGRSRWIFRAK